MKTIGTKEAKDIIRCNGGMRIGDVVCKIQHGKYKVYKGENPVFKTSKIDILLDWLYDNEYLYETRIRLTAKQRDLLRKKLFEYVGITIMMSVALTITIWTIFALLMGMGL